MIVYLRSGSQEHYRGKKVIYNWLLKSKTNAITERVIEVAEEFKNEPHVITNIQIL